jgi:hypothetical protein
MLVIGTLLLVIAFINEPRHRDMKAPYTHWGMHVILAGVILHGLSGLKQKKNQIHS